ncbi:MAG TPA: hypothetical protein VMC86_01890 [Gemmatimonadales bacterium]|nr:hypothetical protein [Gemmatimonadales bacterium]
MKPAVLGAALLLASPVAAAQTPASTTQIGLRFGTDFDANGKDLTRNTLGGVLDHRFGGHWQVAASLSLYPDVGDGALWLSADLQYRPPLVTHFLYLSTGLTEADHGAGKSRTGADLALGLEPRFGGPFTPFAEGKWVIYRWYTSFTVQGGLSVGL